MNRTIKFLSILIVILAILTSCSGGKTKVATTTSEPSLYVSTKLECPTGAGFCASFPIMAGTSGEYEDDVTSVTHLADEFLPTHTAYVTEVYPGDEIEQYVVNVYPDTPESIKALEARYREGWDCQYDPGLPFKASVCTQTYNNPDIDANSVNKEMWVGGNDKLYVFQANTMSLNDPSHAGDFFSSFEPKPKPDEN